MVGEARIGKDSTRTLIVIIGCVLVCPIRIRCHFRLLATHTHSQVDFSLPRYTGNEGVYGDMLAAQDKSFANGPCEGLKFSYGGGSEMSTTPVEFAEPYAFVLSGDEYFGLNLHVRVSLFLSCDNADEAQNKTKSYEHIHENSHKARVTLRA